MFSSVSHSAARICVYLVSLPQHWSHEIIPKTPTAAYQLSMDFPDDGGFQHTLERHLNWGASQCQQQRNFQHLSQFFREGNWAVKYRYMRGPIPVTHDRALEEFKSGAQKLFRYQESYPSESQNVFVSLQDGRAWCLVCQVLLDVPGAAPSYNDQTRRSHQVYHPYWCEGLDCDQGFLDEVSCLRHIRQGACGKFADFLSSFPGLSEGRDRHPELWQPFLDFQRKLCWIHDTLHITDTTHVRHEELQHPHLSPAESPFQVGLEERIAAIQGTEWNEFKAYFDGDWFNAAFRHIAREPQSRQGTTAMQIMLEHSVELIMYDLLCIPSYNVREASFNDRMTYFCQQCRCDIGADDLERHNDIHLFWCRHQCGAVYPSEVERANHEALETCPELTGDQEPQDLTLEDMLNQLVHDIQQADADKLREALNELVYNHYSQYAGTPWLVNRLRRLAEVFRYLVCKQIGITAYRQGHGYIMSRISDFWHEFPIWWRGQPPGTLNRIIEEIDANVRPWPRQHAVQRRQRILRRRRTQEGSPSVSRRHRRILPPRDQSRDAGPSGS